MKTYKSIILFATLMLIYACGGNKTEQQQTDPVRDSLETENRQLNEFIDAVAMSMDSITISEGYIFKGNAEGTPTPSREQIRQRLAAFEDLLKRQKERIGELEKSVGNEQDERTQKLRVIIKSLNQQIEEKNALIAELRTELEKKNVNIASLKQHVAELNTNVESLSQRAQEQEAALTEQTNIINEGYVKVGTKKELKEAGLLSGSGLFSKKKLNVANIDVSKFQKIDMREFETLKINGKKPKVLTHMPASSYTIESNGDGTSTLRVTDPAAFWSISSVLVIQSN